MANYNGQLNTNQILKGIFNMIISQYTFADNIAGVKGELIDLCRTDGSLYGDTKLYYATDVLSSRPWGADAEAINLLQTYRPDSPKCQQITLDTFRTCAVTIDDYLSKQAWSDATSFSDFTSVVLGWLGDTKRVYDATTLNTYIGTTATETGKQKLEIDVTTAVGGATGEEAARIEAGTIAEAVANLLVDLKDVSRDYNDYGFLRSYNVDDIVFVWNSQKMSKLEKRDLPGIYHNEIMDKFGEYTLPARYFGTVNADATAGDGAKVRSLIEQDVAPTSGTGAKKHVFAGDLIPTGFTATAGTSYTTDDKILFKAFHKNSVPFMSAFSVSTEFYNPAALLSNHYLIWGHNTLQYLQNYPFITATEI